MKKAIVLGVLFILPIVAYLFFASGIHNFAKLPIVKEKVSEIDFSDTVKLDGNITVLGFLGKDIDNEKNTFFNLHQKIYTYFYEFNDFQFVYIIPENIDQKVLKAAVDELDNIGNMNHWYFVYASDQEIQAFYKSLDIPIALDANLGSPYVFLIDKERNLRGRDDDDDMGTLYGYEADNVAELANKMKDDVKILLAEYRLALKKNNADR